MPELGKTAFEVVNALQPSLDKMASKDQVAGLTREVTRLANEFGQMNGTLRGLCAWQAKVDERHHHEDENKSAAEPKTDTLEKVGASKYALVQLVLGWVFKFGLLFALIYGLINVEQLLSLVK
jgi:aryl-alcohol dehydrogenase-like predicted oxidoreductase